MSEHYCIAGDIGGTNIRVSLVDAEYQIVSKLKEPTGTEPLSVLFRLIDSISLNVPGGRQACGIGLAVAGIVDTAAGVVLRSPNIPVLSGVHLQGAIAKRYGTCTLIENDANAAAFGEKIAGAGRDFGSFVLLTLGTGIGGGIAIGAFAGADRIEHTYPDFVDAGHPMDVLVPGAVIDIDGG